MLSSDRKKKYIEVLVLALKIKNSFLVEGDHAKVSLWGVDSLLGDCMFIPADWGS